MDEFLGTILIWPINFAPRLWQYCHGQLVSISDNTALFSLLGTTYGGDGRSTFGLPNLQGRVPVGAGSSPGTGNYYLGQMGGHEVVQLNVNNLPSHNHVAKTDTMTVTIKASTEDATSNTPTENAALAKVVQERNSFPIYKPDGTPTVDLNTGATVTGNVTIENTGNNQPVSVVQPYLALNYIICMEGIFPSRQ